VGGKIYKRYRVYQEIFLIQISRSLAIVSRRAGIIIEFKYQSQSNSEGVVLISPFQGLINVSKTILQKFHPFGIA